MGDIRVANYNYTYKNMAFNRQKNAVRNNDYNRSRQRYNFHQKAPKVKTVVNAKEEQQKEQLQWMQEIKQNIAMDPAVISAKRFMKMTEIYPLSYVYDDVRYNVKRYLWQVEKFGSENLRQYMNSSVNMEKVEKEYARLMNNIKHKEVLIAKKDAIVKKFTNLKQIVKGKWQALTKHKQKDEIAMEEAQEMPM